MTCIVGLLNDGKVYIGGDSAGVSGFDKRIRKDPKVFKTGEFVIGFTSSFRMGQLLMNSFSSPELKEGQDIYKYMTTNFINAVRSCLRDGGYSRVDCNEEVGGTFLVGFRGRLFCVENDFQVGEVAAGYDAIGCGANYALGSLYSSKELGPENRLKFALEAAEAFSAGVSGPFTIIASD